MTSEPTPLSAEERARRWALAEREEWERWHAQFPLTPEWDSAVAARLILEQERALRRVSDLRLEPECPACNDLDLIMGHPESPFRATFEGVRALKGTPDA